MTDKDRVRHLLDLAAEEIPDTLDLWNKIHAKATQSPVFEKDAARPAFSVSPTRQSTNPHHGRALSFSFAMMCATLILGGIVLLNARGPATDMGSLHAGFPSATKTLASPDLSLQGASRMGQGKAVEAIWSPDGMLMLVMTTQGIWIYNAADLTKPIENIYPEVSFSQAPVFSYDSTHLAFLDGGVAHIWNLRQRRDIMLDLSHETTQPSSLALTSNTNILAVSDRSSNIHFYDVQTQKLLSSAHIIEGATSILNMEFNAQGTSLALAGQSISPSLFLLEDLKGQWSGDVQALALPVDPTYESPLGTIAYSGDRTHIVGRFNDRLAVWQWDGYILRKVNWFDNVDGKGRLVMNRAGTQVALLSQDMWVWDLPTDTVSFNPRIPGTDLAWTGAMNLNADWSQISMVDSQGRLSVRAWSTGEEIMSTEAYTLDRIH
jgi:WD40 repeat protein